MPRHVVFLAIALLVSGALAGCAGRETGEQPTPTPSPSPTPTATPPATPPPATPSPTTSTPEPEPPVDSSTYRLAAAGIPTQAKPSTNFSFVIWANGTLERTSTHLGAHYADNDTSNPPVAGRKNCAHTFTETALPASFDATCALESAGTWYLWPHVQLNESGDIKDFWTAEPFVVRARDYNLTLGNLPAAGTGPNFTVLVNSTALGTTDDPEGATVTVYYWNATQTDPAPANAAGQCAEATGRAVGSREIRCAIAAGELTRQEVFMRAHMRLVDGDTTLTWWSGEHRVAVTPVGVGGLPPLGP